MTDLVVVRIRNSRGEVEKVVSRGHALRHDLEILDDPVRDGSGRLRPTTRAGGRPLKPYTTVDEAAQAQHEQNPNDPPDEGSATDPALPEEAQQ